MKIIEKIKSILARAYTPAILITFMAVGYVLGFKYEQATIVAASYNTLASADMVAEINAERKDAGLKPLTENPILDKTAEIKACDMVKRSYFDHTDPDGLKPWHLFRENGYDYTYAGENLAQNYGDVEAMRLLMLSPEHRDNILSPHYTEVGVARCGKDTVQHFGAR